MTFVTPHPLEHVDAKSISGKRADQGQMKTSFKPIPMVDGIFSSVLVASFGDGTENFALAFVGCIQQCDPLKQKAL